MTQQIATNVHWHHGEVTREDRNRLMGQKGVTLWFTGLSGSGKSTVSVALENALFEHGKLAYRLDGDNIRLGINKNLGFSAEDRTENIRRIGEVAKLMNDAGVITMTAFISPYREDRDEARAISGDSFVEVYVKAALEVCEERDPKGLYKKARAGEIPEFTGISAPYEEPENAEIVVDTGEQNIEECTEAVLAYMRERGVIS